MEITEGKRPSGRLKCRWEDNSKMDMKEVGCDARNWIDLVQDWDLVDLCKSGNETPGSLTASLFNPS